MKVLKIIAVLDGRPGHEKQTHGIIKALERHVPVEVSYQKIGVSPVSDVLAWLKAAAGFFRAPGNSPDGVDLVIGTGTHTHPHVMGLGRARGAKKIICMSPAPFLISRFDLCLIPAHDGVKSRENIFFTTGPPNISVCKNRHERDKGLILIGGKDDKSHVWDSKKILEYIQEIVSSEPVDMIWTISSSPRTPEETEDQIQRFAVQRERVNFFRFSDTQKGWVEDQYDASSMVWVTADSMSMIYEALSAGCSVGIIPMKWKRRQNKFLAGEQDLYRKGLAVSYDLWRDSRVTPEPGRSINESDKCAREILRRWGLENSP